MIPQFTYIDLFSGAGGMSLGFDREGFKNLFAVEIDKNACKTYSLNFPHHLLLNDDIKLLTENQIKGLIKNIKVDVVIGGPPCQGFSMAGNIGRKFLEDERNQLFKEFARIVSIVQPNYFIMENVARLYNHNNGNTRIDILDLFKSLNYSVECRVLNTFDYGVPQIRKRIIFIGNKNSNSLRFPIKAENKLTIKDAIQNLPTLKSGESSNIKNHVAMKHSTQMLEKMQYVKDGGDRSQIPIELRPKTGDIRKYIRYNSNLPSVCVTGDMRKIFHYEQNRALTVRELACLQTFPLDFEFYGTSLSQQQQIGNAVPPIFAQALARTIKNMRETDEKLS